MPERDNLMFAYGTLLSADVGLMGRPQRSRLAREARLLGAASTEGRLYDLGRYPGLVLPGGAGEIVHGELLELATAALTLRWLDAYEGIVPGRHPYNDYERSHRPVLVSDGREPVMAWVYLYRGGVANASLIPSGRWLSP